MAEAGDAGDVWIQADIQTAGRGRLGRDWRSETGNLFCTGLFYHDGDLASAAQLSFVAAIATARLCKAFAPQLSPGIKWPNDVQIDGAKLAGILLESGTYNGRIWVSVGIGVNLLNHPDDLPYPATNLAAHIDSQDPEDIPNALAALAILAREFDSVRAAWLAGGMGAIRDEWLNCAVGMGQTVHAKLAKEQVIGTAFGLGDNGELKVRLPDGRVRLLSSGEVFFN